MLLLLTFPWTGDARAAKLSEDLNSAVAYAYFRVGDDTQDIPGISLNDFKAQITEISNPDLGYNPASLDTIIKAQSENKSLPAQTITLTFEGSDSSFIRNAFPLLEDHHIPFTLFISPGLLDQSSKTNDPSLLSWDDVRTIAESPLATIGMTSYSYTHINPKTAADILADINHARTRFREELETEPRYFSYPYGEYNAAFLTALKQQGFVASFGQQSGIIGKSTPRTALPRFTMTDDFSDIERFRLTSLSLPFPVTDMEPLTSLSPLNPPHPSFTVTDDIPLADLKQLKCFASGIENVDIQPIGPRHFEIRFSNGFEEGRGRLNCTIPAPPNEESEEPRWRWLGFLFSTPED